jgi:hypothetical protein
MDLLEAKVLLSNMRQLPGDIQFERKKEIVEAVKIFWDAGPSDEEFGDYMSGLILPPEVLYHIVTHPLGGKKL